MKDALDQLREALGRARCAGLSDEDVILLAAERIVLLREELRSAQKMLSGIGGAVVPSRGTPAGAAG